MCRPKHEPPNSLYRNKIKWKQKSFNMLLKVAQMLPKNVQDSEFFGIFFLIQQPGMNKKNK